ncbi:MAG: alkylation response protein AidB-like acyl-CoA dehydrogenase [Alcanivorax sp.]|jgi:alkylation response protein AidB-like acyl-CoA dehydrogenase
MSVIGNTALSFSEEQAMLLDVAREFCQDKSPISRVREQLESVTGYDAAIWQEMVDLGWLGISIPEQYGGSGLGVATVVPVVESMGRSMLGTPLISTTLAAQLILRASDSSVAEQWLPSMVEGSPATIAQLESMDWGDELVTCSVDADGVLSGQKMFVPDGAAAQIFVVTVLHGGEPALAVVPRALIPEAGIIEHTIIDQTKRAARVDFTGVTVPADHLLTGPAVSEALRHANLLGALLTAAEATGSAARCLDTVVDYLKTRKQFGKLIGSYQALKHPSVDILCDVDSSRSLLYHAATLVTDDPLDRDTEIACRMAKAKATETLLYASDRAVQFHGGMGFTYECDAQLYIRRAQWTQQQYGDARHHRKRLASLLLDNIAA